MITSCGLLRSRRRGDPRSSDRERWWYAERGARCVRGAEVACRDGSTVQRDQPTSPCSGLFVDVLHSELVPERVPRGPSHPARHLAAHPNSQTQLASAEPFASTARPPRPTCSGIRESRNAYRSSRRADRAWDYINPGKRKQCGSTLNQRLEVRGQPRNVLRRSSQSGCEMIAVCGHLKLIVRREM